MAALSNDESTASRSDRPGRGGLRLRRRPAPAAGQAAGHVAASTSARCPAGSPSSPETLDGDGRSTAGTTAARARRSTPTPRTTPTGGRPSSTASCPPARSAENLRTTGLDLTGAVLGERWAVGTRAARGHRTAHPVRELRPVLGRPGPGQAVHRARRQRCLPAGAADRGARRRRRRRDRVPPRPRGHRRRSLPVVMTHSPGCPSSPPRWGTCRSRTSRGSPPGSPPASGDRSDRSADTRDGGRLRGWGRAAPPAPGRAVPYPVCDKTAPEEFCHGLARPRRVRGARGGLGHGPGPLGRVHPARPRRSSSASRSR